MHTALCRGDSQCNVGVGLRSLYHKCTRNLEELSWKLFRPLQDFVLVVSAVAFQEQSEC